MRKSGRLLGEIEYNGRTLARSAFYIYLALMFLHNPAHNAQTQANTGVTPGPRFAEKGFIDVA